jgi:hypothetical protein
MASAEGITGWVVPFFVAGRWTSADICERTCQLRREADSRVVAVLSAFRVRIVGWLTTRGEREM